MSVKGDHVYKSLFGINGNPITHHGIDCGDGYIIEHAGYFNSLKKVKKEAFFRGADIKVKSYSRCDVPDVVVKRAYDALDDKNHARQKYCLLTSNCEHFATWCKTGVTHSQQSENALHGGLKAANGIVNGTAVGFVGKKAAETAAKNSLKPVAKFMVSNGLKAAPTAGKAVVGAAGIGGLATSLATDYVIEKCLEHNPSHSQKETNARNMGRLAGKTGTLVGAVGGGIAGAAVGGTAVAMVGVVAAPVVLGGLLAAGVYHLTK